jgi:hypothetical protein
MNQALTPRRAPRSGGLLRWPAGLSGGRLAAWLAAGVAGIALTGCVVAPVDGGYYDDGSYPSGGYY